MMNSVNFVGRLVKDVDLKYTPSGTAVANMNVAVNRSVKTEGQPEADFIPMVVWNKQAENMANYLAKGSLISVEGRLQTRTYDGQDGKKVWVTEVVAERVQFLDSKKSEQSA